MKNKRDPNARVTRWRLKLDEYEYELVFKPGVTNVNADALSRKPVLILEVVPMTNKRILVLGTIQEEPDQILSIEQRHKLNPDQIPGPENQARNIWTP